MLAILLFQRMHTLWFCSNCCNCTLTVHLSAPSVGQKYHSVMQSDISIIRGHIVASLWPGKSVPGWSLAYKILTKRFRLLPFFFFSSGKKTGIKTNWKLRSVISAISAVWSSDSQTRLPAQASVVSPPSLDHGPHSCLQFDTLLFHIQGFQFRFLFQKTHLPLKLFSWQLSNSNLLVAILSFL